MRVIPLTCIIGLALATALPATAQNGPSQPVPAQGLEKAALTPPEIVEKVDPEYPAQALAERRTGEVVLQLDIDETGKVVAAQVAAGAGYGMDEAAVTAALRMTFNPARRGDKAVRSRILYRMVFTLKPAELPQPTNETEKATSEIPSALEGFVRLPGADVPYAGANVEVTFANGRVERTMTDAQGHWSIEGAQAGQVRVDITAPGYEPIHETETLKAGERVELKLALHPSDGSIEVSVKGERPDREVTRRTMEREEIAFVPGTGGDALKVVESMPGVARTPAYSGMIVVRGSSPYGTMTFVDGMYVPAIYHFGGLSSIVPTEMIDSIDFYPGNFSAKYGRVTGGVIDVKLREIEHDGQYHGLAQVDLIDARVMLRGPVPLAKGWSFNLGARRSHIDAWIGAVMSSESSFNTAPVYYDWQAFAETKPTAHSLFRVGVFGADDRLEMVLKKAIAEEPGMGNSLKGQLRTARLQAFYRDQLNRRVSLNATAAIGMDREYSRFGSLSNVDIDYVPILFRGDLSYRISDQFLARIGPDIVVYQYDANVTSIRPPEPGEVEGSHSNRPMLRYDDAGWFTAPAAFAEMEWTPNSRAKVLLGGRADYFNVTKHWDFDPRLNARYDLHSGANRTTVKAGVGLFSERPQIIQAIEPFGTPSLKSNRSVHSSVGIEQVVGEQVEVSIEAFHKYLDHLVVAEQFEDGSNGYSNAGKGYVYGTETMVRWKPGGRFFGWIAYTLSRSVRRDHPDEAERVYEYDQTHNLTVLGSYNLGHGFRVGGKFRLVSGNPYTPCVGGLLNGGSGSYDCIQGTVNSRRIPAFHQLDLRVDKTWDFESYKISAYLDVQNAYNRANPEGISYNYRYTKPDWQTGIPMIPSLGLRGEF
jgi:TonB family protein